MTFEENSKKKNIIVCGFTYSTCYCLFSYICNWFFIRIYQL